MDGYFGRWADLNNDGEVDDFEKFIEMDMIDTYNRELYEDDEDEDELTSELEFAGLDYDDISWMDEDERRETLEDAVLDPDDYDF